jgi:hypothetical protein
MSRSCRAEGCSPFNAAEEGSRGHGEWGWRETWAAEMNLKAAATVAGRDDFCYCNARCKPEPRPPVHTLFVCPPTPLLPLPLFPQAWTQ